MSLAHAEVRRNLDQCKLGNTQSQRTTYLARQQLRNQGPAALGSRMELEHIQLAVVGLDQRGHGAALAKRLDIANGRQDR